MFDWKAVLTPAIKILSYEAICAYLQSHSFIMHVLMAMPHAQSKVEKQQKWWAVTVNNAAIRYNAARNYYSPVTTPHDTSAMSLFMRRLNGTIWSPWYTLVRELSSALQLCLSRVKMYRHAVNSVRNDSQVIVRAIADWILSTGNSPCLRWSVRGLVGDGRTSDPKPPGE